MRMTRKLLALALVLVLTLTAGIGAMSVFAEDITDTLTDEELSALLNEGEEMELSDADLSNSDYVSLSSLELVTAVDSYYNFSMLVPGGGNLLTTDSSDAAIAAISGTKSDFIDQGVMVYAVSADNGQMVYAFSEENAYANYIGDYKKLSEPEMLNLVTAKRSEGENNGLTYDEVKFVKINGVHFLQASGEYDYSGLIYKLIDLTTVLNGRAYTIQLQFAGANNKADEAAVLKILESIKLDGVSANSMNTVTIVLIAVCAVLFIVLAFVVFFLIRFSIYSKLSGSRFNIFGFDIPKSK